jgi:hypothetical protein
MYQFDNGWVGFSWSDGTPTQQAAKTTTGVYVSQQVRI